MFFLSFKETGRRDLLRHMISSHSSLQSAIPYCRPKSSRQTHREDCHCKKRERREAIEKDLTESFASRSIVSLLCLSFHFRNRFKHSFRRTSFPGCRRQCNAVWFARLRLLTLPRWSVSRCLNERDGILRLFASLFNSSTLARDIDDLGSVFIQLICSIRWKQREGRETRNVTDSFSLL